VTHADLDGLERGNLYAMDQGRDDEEQHQGNDHTEGDLDNEFHASLPLRMILPIGRPALPEKVDVSRLTSTLQPPKPTENRPFRPGES
jgi:hypothetical protein